MFQQLVDRIVKSISDDPDINKEADQYARKKLSSLGIRCPDADTEELSEFEPYYRFVQLYISQIVLAAYNQLAPWDSQ